MKVNYWLMAGGLLAFSSGALAATVPSAAYNGLSYYNGKESAGPVVRSTLPGQYHKSDDRRRREHGRRRRSDDSGS